MLTLGMRRGALKKRFAASLPAPSVLRLAGGSSRLKLANGAYLKLAHQ